MLKVVGMNALATHSVDVFVLIGDHEISLFEWIFVQLDLQGQMKLFGTIVYPKNGYLTMQFSRGGKNVVCEDYLDNMVGSSMTLPSLSVLCFNLFILVSILTPGASFCKNLSSHLITYVSWTML